VRRRRTFFRSDDPPSILGGVSGCFAIPNRSFSPSGKRAFWGVLTLGISIVGLRGLRKSRSAGAMRSYLHHPGDVR
jgi:hypothetical protein